MPVPQPKLRPAARYELQRIANAAEKAAFDLLLRTAGRPTNADEAALIQKFHSIAERANERLAAYERTQALIPTLTEVA